MLNSLSLVLTDETRDAPVLDAAIALALREDAHLDVVALGVEPVTIEAVPMAAAQIVIESGRAEAEDQATRLAAWARARLPAELRNTVEPRLAQGMSLGMAAARAARFSDLTLAARPYGRGRNGFSSALIEGLLFGGGAPLLVVPDAGCDMSRPFGRILLAWNNTDEALRATRAAMPFLRKAGRVDIVVIDPPVHGADRADPGGELSLWLARHGIRAEVAVMARTEPRIADVLLRVARDKGADAVVMGAYGHSRLREAVLGGATRDMLAEVALPLILAH
jgi:nucleotide-binding universal stress UspA family protein